MATHSGLRINWKRILRGSSPSGNQPGFWTCLLRLGAEKSLECCRRTKLDLTCVQLKGDRSAGQEKQVNTMLDVFLYWINKFSALTQNQINTVTTKSLTPRHKQDTQTRSEMHKKVKTHPHVLNQASTEHSFLQMYHRHQFTACVPDVKWHSNKISPAPNAN